MITKESVIAFVIQGGDLKFELNFKPAQLFNQSEFYRQKLPKHPPACFK